MKPLRYAVGSRDSDEWECVTTFYHIGDMICSNPVREGHVDNVHYRFKRLKEAEYQSYIEMEVLPEHPSSKFVLSGMTDDERLCLEDEQAAYELDELNDVFDQPE